MFVVGVIVFCSVLQSQAVSGNVQGLLSNPVALPDLNFTGTENSSNVKSRSGIAAQKRGICCHDSCAISLV